MMEMSYRCCCAAAGMVFAADWRFFAFFFTLRNQRKENRQNLGKGPPRDKRPQSLSPKEGMRKPTAIALARAAHRRRSQLLRAPTGSPAFTAHATRPHTLTPRPQPQPPPSQTPLESTRRPLAASVANSSSTAAAQRQNIRQKRCHVVRLPARGVQSTTGDGSHARRRPEALPSGAGCSCIDLRRHAVTERGR